MVNNKIIIVGAGVVGLALALDLAQAGFEITVVEKQDLQYLKNAIDLTDTEYDARVFAINWASQQFFESMSVWDKIVSYRVSPYEGMQVWDAEGAGHIQFDSDNLVESELGHIIEQKVLLKVLRDQLICLNNVTIQDNCALENLILSETVSQLYTQNGRLSANLIIGADGASSWVRTQAGFVLTGWPYGQTALVATIQTERSHQRIARQRFAKEGPLALLPLDNLQLCSIVWMTTPERAVYLKNLNTEDFSSELTRSFGSSLGKLTLLQDKRAVFPLKMQHAKTYVKPGCVLVGDAAHVIHPLAGLGMNLGLQNAKVLGELLKNQNNILGSLSLLRKYERLEKNRALLMIGAMEGLKQGFGSQNSLIKRIRNRGLNFVNDNYILKKWFIHQAMGK